MEEESIRRACLNKLGIKSDDFQTRLGAIVGIDTMGRICPEKARETYESFLSTIERGLKFALLCWGSIGLLRNLGTHLKVQR